MKRNKINSLFVIVIACLTCLASCEKGFYELNLVSNSKYGVDESIPVAMNGQEIGKIIQVTTYEKQTISKIRIVQDVKIPIDSKFIIKSGSILGDTFVEIIPSSEEAYIQGNDTIYGMIERSSEFDSAILKIKKKIHEVNK